MTILVDIRHRLGAFHLSVDFQSQGHLTALFGPSGSGKTSVVNAIGGLLTPDDGRIAVGDEILVDTARSINLPRHRRRIGYVFQDARLFPHLSVGQNLRYGRWFRPSAERYADLTQIVELLGISDLLERRPAALSGGEKQRVAIGRALAASPQLLLMDEPLASLDDARKAEILPYIERLRDELQIPIVYVSHSIVEVARLATDIVLLDRGRVTAAGRAADMMLRTDLVPAADRAEAGALLDMTVLGHEPDYELTRLGSPAGEMRVPAAALPVGATVRLRLRARDVMLALQRPQQISGLNVLSGVISLIGPPLGAQLDVTVDCSGQSIVARITRLSASALQLRPGLQVFAVVKSVTFDAVNATPVTSHREA